MADLRTFSNLFLLNSDKSEYQAVEAYVKTDLTVVNSEVQKTFQVHLQWEDIQPQETIM